MRLVFATWCNWCDCRLPCGQGSHFNFGIFGCLSGHSETVSQLARFEVPCIDMPTVMSATYQGPGGSVLKRTPQPWEMKHSPVSPSLQCDLVMPITFRNIWAGTTWTCEEAPRQSPSVTRLTNQRGNISLRPIHKQTKQPSLYWSANLTHRGAIPRSQR